MEIEETTTSSDSETGSLLQVPSPKKEIDEKVDIGEYIVGDKHDEAGNISLFFTPVMGRNGKPVPNNVVCKKCNKVFETTKHKLSNLKKHECYRLNQLQTENGIPLNEDDSSTTEMLENFDNIHNNKLTQLLTRWIMKECRSYDLLDSPGLKSIFGEIVGLGSTYDGDIDVNELLPSVPEILENLSEIYEQCFEAVKVEIALIENDAFSLTADIRTDDGTDRSYIAVTIHFLKSGVLIFRLLGFQPIENEQSSDINEIIKRILERFELKVSNKTILVTNRDIAHHIMEKDFQSLPSISHLLSNALLQAMQEVPETMTIISEAKNLVYFLIQRKQENVLGNLLNNSYHNRWLSTYNMLNSIAENWHKIETILDNINEKSRVSNLNIEHLKAVLEIFQIFAEAFEMLEDTSSATLHLVTVCLHELKKSCCETDSQFKFIDIFKANIRQHLLKIDREDITILHKLALFLYPPTNQLLPFNWDERRAIEEECMLLMQNYEHVLKPRIKQETESSSLTTTRRKKLFADFILSGMKHQLNNIFEQEIEFYKNANILLSENFDVFDWWEKHKKNFPLLFKLSSTVLSIPATCAASNRVFSKGSSLFGNKQLSSSKAAEIERIMFINTNSEQSNLDNL